MKARWLQNAAMTELEACLNKHSVWKPLSNNKQYDDSIQLGYSTQFDDSIQFDVSTQLDMLEVGVYALNAAAPRPPHTVRHLLAPPSRVRE